MGNIFSSESSQKSQSHLKQPADNKEIVRQALIKAQHESSVKKNNALKDQIYHTYIQFVENRTAENIGQLKALKTLADTYQKEINDFLTEHQLPYPDTLKCTIKFPSEGGVQLVSIDEFANHYLKLATASMENLAKKAVKEEKSTALTTPPKKQKQETKLARKVIDTPGSDESPEKYGSSFTASFGFSRENTSASAILDKLKPAVSMQGSEVYDDQDLSSESDSSESESEENFSRPVVTATK